MSNLRCVAFPGGTAFVGAAKYGVRLTLNGWEDGVDVCLTPAKAREFARAMNEFALAAEQQAASDLVASDRVVSK